MNPTLSFCIIAHFAVLATDNFAVATAVDLGSIRQRYVNGNAKLATVDVRWKHSSRLLQQRLAEGVDIIAPDRDCDCRAVVKGDKRLYDVRCFAPAGRQIPQDFRRRALCYDGKSTWVLHGPANATVHSGDRRAQARYLEEFLALQGHPTDLGYQFWAQSDPNKPPDQPFSCDVAAILANGEYLAVGNREFHGTDCVVISSKQDRIFLDPKRGYAIVGREACSPQGSISTRYVCDDFFEIGEGLWLAKRIVLEMFAGADVWLRFRCSMQDIRFDVADDAFRLDLEPGTFVGDTRHLAPRPDGGLPVVGYHVPSGPA
ncbi:MAG TPA: hypothetical protein VNH11_12125, partial [Pirellulales bacterium]|nr:hypothetical protein [Pirellulales bacterium]